MMRRLLPAPLATLGEKVSLAGEILVAYTGARWQMRKGDIREMTSAARAQLGPSPCPELTTEETWKIAVHLGHIVNRTLRIAPTDSRCLVQSLVLSRLLSARGITSTLVIGARPRPTFAAHAWVEHAGRPVLPVRGYGGSRLLEL